MDAAIGHRDRFSFSSNLSLEEMYTESPTVLLSARNFAFLHDSRTKQEKFSAERNWGKDNTPRNLLLALVLIFLHLGVQLLYFILVSYYNALIGHRGGRACRDFVSSLQPFNGYQYYSVIILCFLANGEVK